MLCLVELQPAVLATSPIVAVFGDLKPPASVLNRRSAGQLNLCLSKLADDLLRAVSSPLHSDLPFTTQIMRLHLDPF